METSTMNPQPPLRGLYAFVREHLAIANGIVLASGTLVAVLDFMAPRVSVLPRLVYSATAALLAPMVLAAVAPSLTARALSLVGVAFKREQGAPVWKRPAWQAVAALLAVVTVVGFASVAKASEGGLLAGGSPALRGLQASLLRLEGDAGQIKIGVGDANKKLDILVGDSKDPQRELVARGYAYGDSGLATAIERGDARAAGLFAKAGYRAAGDAPLMALFSDKTPWSAELADLLPRSMFGRKEACDRSLGAGMGHSAAALFANQAHALPEKVAAYARLCDAGKLVQELRNAEASGSGAGDARGQLLALALKH